MKGRVGERRENIVGRVGWPRGRGSFDQLQRVMSFASDAAVTIRYPNVVRLLSHLALLARRSSTTPRRGSVWMSNFIIPYYLRPFKARPSRTEALAAYTAVMLSQDLSHHEEFCQAVQCHDPGKLVRLQRLLCMRVRVGLFSLMLV